jgi:hypothetical protein
MKSNGDGKMKFRFSNGKDFAVTFDASDINSFADQAASALRSFRIQTERRVHRGELHKTVSWFETTQLHMQTDFDTDLWLAIARKRAAWTELPSSETNDLSERFSQDERWFTENLTELWVDIVNTFEARRRLSEFLMGFGDTLRKLTDNDNNEDK